MQDRIDELEADKRKEEDTKLEEIALKFRYGSFDGLLASRGYDKPAKAAETKSATKRSSRKGGRSIVATPETAKYLFDDGTGNTQLWLSGAPPKIAHDLGLMKANPVAGPKAKTLDLQKAAKFLIADEKRKELIANKGK